MQRIVLCGLLLLLAASSAMGQVHVDLRLEQARYLAENPSSLSSTYATLATRRSGIHLATGMSDSLLPALNAECHQTSLAASPA
jgi:hypothetical protein